MTSVNKLLPINIKGTNDITGTYSTVCLLANANTELSGNTYTKALAVACDLSAGYVLTLSGDTFLRGRTDVSGSLYVNGTQITGSGGGGGSQDLSSVLFYGNSANYVPIIDVSGIQGTNIDISGNTTFNQSYQPGRLENIGTTTTPTFNITYPMKHFYNFFNAGSTVVNLPSLASLRASQQTQISLSKAIGATLDIYPYPSESLRLPSGALVSNYLWNTATSMIILQCSVVGGGTWRIVYIETVPGSGGTQDLSGVLSIGNSANYIPIVDVSGIEGANIDISGNTVFNSAFMPGRLEDIDTATTATFNMVFPLRQFYNFYNNGGYTVLNLPSITTLTASQQTQITLNKPIGLVLDIYPSAGNTLRLPNGSSIANYLWNTTTSMLVIHCTPIGGGTWRICYIENPVNDNLADVMNRGNQASTYLDMNFNSIDNASSVNTTDMTSTNLITANQLYTENFYYSNISADITITNWQAQTPAYTTNGVYLQYSGTASYTGTPGIVTSGSALYVFQIVRGIGNGAYFLTYFPPGTTSQQAFTMQATVNQTFTFKTINYSLQPGQYIWGCWYQSQQNVSATLNTFIKTSGGTILAQETGVFPGNDFPNWIFKSLAFTITTPTSVFFEATSVATSFNCSVIITGLELTQTGAMVVTDTVTNKTATISGTQSFLNSLYVNSGLQVDSGGIDVVGGISTSTAFGSSNISINSPFGSTSKANNSGDIISIGSAVNQDMSSNVTGNYRVIAIGNGANTGTVTLQDAVSIGYNARCINNALYSVAIGSRAGARGSYTVAIAPNELAGSNEGCIGGNNAVVGFGACGSNVYNGFGVLSSTQNVYVGTRAGYNAADNNNTGIGFQALWTMNGRNGVTANGNSGKITQQNTALGHNAGSLRTGYNDCTFLGAGADASVENLVNATAIGWGAQVDVSNAIVLGSTGTRTKVSGDLYGVTTINGLSYPPAGATSNLQTVLSYGNNAGIYSIDMSNNSINNILTTNTQLLTQAQTNVVSPDISLENTNASTTRGVLISTNKLKPAGGLSAGDTLLQIQANGTNNTNLAVQYANDEIDVVESTAGAHEAVRRFQVASAGTMTTVCEMNSNFTVYRPMILNTVGIHNAYKVIAISSATTNYESVWANYVGNYSFITGSLASTITIGGASTFPGAICRIENRTAFAMTLTVPALGGLFLGSYGSGNNFFILYPQQNMSFTSDGSSWQVTQVNGMPMSYRRVQNAVQTLITAGVSYSALFVVDDISGIQLSNGVNTWGGRKLDYSAGVFTNNTGYNMKIQVDACIYFTSNTNFRFIGYRLLNTTRNPNNRSGFVVLPTNSTLNGLLSFQTTLANGDSFDIFLQSQGNNIVTSSGTVSANMNTIIITRIG